MFIYFRQGCSRIFSKILLLFFKIGYPIRSTEKTNPPNQNLMILTGDDFQSYI